MTNILGINSVFHESSASLLSGDRVCAAEEERLSNIKHGKEASPYGAWLLPFEALAYCMEEASLTLADIDHVAYSYDPWLDMRKNWVSILGAFCKGNLKQVHRDLARLYFNCRIKSLLTECAPKRHELRRFFLIPGKPKYHFHFVEHHLAHAASSFFVSPFKEAAIASIDGIGESTCTLLAYGKNTKIDKIKEIEYPNSLGLFYEEITKFLGFQRNNDEHKVMTLAALGTPRYRDEIRKIIHLTQDGAYKVKIDFKQPSLYCAREFSKLFGPHRVWEGEITDRHVDIATSAQVVLEEVVLHMLRWLHSVTKSENLCLAGGVALNCVLNERIRKESPFKRIYIQPASHDAGTALGAALYVRHTILEEPRKSPMDHVFLGPFSESDKIEAKLRSYKIPYQQCSDVAIEAAKLLADGKVVGWFQGRMEWGPRALGNRSILADPRDKSLKDRLNTIKGRPDFLPFAPSILEERYHEFFEDRELSPFMLFARKVLPNKREQIPAVLHVDGTARVQTVSIAHNPLYHKLIEHFADITGIPLVLNTSLNRPGKPIVCTIEQAIDCFFNTGLDAIILGDFLVNKHYDKITENKICEQFETVI